jgi:hypothetical protein
MNLRVLAATVAGGVTLFLLGWLVYGVLLESFMREHMNQFPGLMKEPMPEMVPLILANMVAAGLMAYVFEYWATIRTFMGGLIGGAIIMFLVVLYIDLSFWAFMNLMKDLTGLVVDVVASTVLGAITGGVVGFVLGAMHGRAGEAAA